MSLITHLHNPTDDSIIKILVHDHTKLTVAITEAYLLVYGNIVNDLRNIKTTHSDPHWKEFSANSINNHPLEESIVPTAQNKIDDSNDNGLKEEIRQQENCDTHDTQPHSSLLCPPIVPLVCRSIFEDQNSNSNLNPDQGSNDEFSLVDFALDDSYVYLITDQCKIFVYSIRDLNSKTQSSLRLIHSFDSEPNVIRIVNIPPFSKGKKRKKKNKKVQSATNDTANFEESSMQDCSKASNVLETSRRQDVQETSDQNLSVTFQGNKICSNFQGQKTSSNLNTDHSKTHQKMDLYDNLSEVAGERIVIGFEDGHLQIIHFNDEDNSLHVQYQSKFGLHNNIYTDMSWRSGSRKIVTCAMDYKVIQYTIDDQFIDFSFDIQEFLQRNTPTKQNTHGVSESKLFNPPHPHTMSLSTDIMNEKGIPRYGLFGLGSGDVFCLDLDQSFVVKWIPQAHNYIVSFVQFLPTNPDEKQILHFLTASNDGHIHLYKIDQPKKLKDRQSWVAPLVRLDHAKNALVQLARIGILKEENIEYYAKVCSRINYVQMYDGYMLVADESGFTYCYKME